MNPNIAAIGDLVHPTTASPATSYTPPTSPPPHPPQLRPQSTFGPTADFLYGKCLYTSAGKESLKLAKDLAAAARSKEMQDSIPARLAGIQTYEAQYWNDTITGE